MVSAPNLSQIIMNDEVPIPLAILLTGGQKSFSWIQIQIFDNPISGVFSFLKMSNPKYVYNYILISF